VCPTQSSDPRAKAVAALDAFVLRARRVRAHSLAADPGTLEALAKPKWHIVVDDRTGVATVTRHLPPEESVESLAARVRPLILQRDPVHYGKVLNAVGLLLQNNPDAADALLYVKWLRGQWSAINSESDESRAYSIQKGRVDGEGPTSDISDNSLAFAWFYGDVVHADAARRDSARDFNVVDRFEAAVHVVARIAWLTLATLNFIEQLRDAGQLKTDDWAFEEEVVVGVTEITREANVLVAPEGTPKPESLHEDFSDQWKPLSEMRSEIAYDADEPGPSSPSGAGR
jgi:hypothetical protein